jgi:hypothetical protein
MESIRSVVLNYLDRSFVVVHWLWGVFTSMWSSLASIPKVGMMLFGGVMALGGLGLWVYRTLRTATPSPEPPAALAAAATNPTPPPSLTSYTVARELARESARKIAESLDSGAGNEVHALRLAVEGVTLARVARDMASDVTRLSKDLGVDMVEYQAYARKVMNDAEGRLRYHRG